MEKAKSILIAQLGEVANLKDNIAREMKELEQFVHTTKQPTGQAGRYIINSGRDILEYTVKLESKAQFIRTIFIFSFPDTDVAKTLRENQWGIDFIYEEATLEAMWMVINKK